MGEEAKAILHDLARAVIDLDNYKWDGSLPIKPYGLYGDEFSFAFHAQYVFIFRRYTERDERKQPVRVHIYLEVIGSKE